MSSEYIALQYYQYKQRTNINIECEWTESHWLVYIHTCLQRDYNVIGYNYLQRATVLQKNYSKDALYQIILN